VDLTQDLVELLGEWWGACGRPSGPTLVFPGDSLSGHLSGSNLLNRYLYPAMISAGIPRLGATGESRVFHSLRHTYSKRALESGAQITWLSRHLGRSSLKGDDGHLWPLGTSGAQGSSCSARGCVWRLADSGDAREFSSLLCRRLLMNGFRLRVRPSASSSRAANRKSI
jgi:hypothetical protein